MPKNGKSKSQRFLVKTPVAGADDKVFWRTIGSAWLNEETGERPQNISIKLDALPLGPNLQCYPADEEPNLPPALED